MCSFDASCRTTVVFLVFDVFQDCPVVDIIIFEPVAKKEVTKQSEQVVVINATTTATRQLNMLEIFHKLFWHLLTELFGSY
jgi:hypothetical protein